MKKIIPQTADKRNHNIDQIAQLFPQVICEKEDADGNTIKAIDFELFKQQFSADIVEGSDERYRLDWPGKRASILKANTPITITLKPDRNSSVNFDTTENVYIEGDNFEVLKILQESYLGKIKMIYIDPPYNTGKDFVYKDNFKVSKGAYKDELGTEDEEGGKLFKNTDSNGRFHSDWLSMMYERLLVTRDLLTDDGVIFMSIDDNEVHNLRKIADEVFGEENFVSQFIWKKKQGGGNDSNAIVVEHEYIVSFSKSVNKLTLNKDKNYKLDDSLYPFNDEKGEYGLITLDKSSIRFSDSLVFEIKDSEGKVYFPRVVKGKQSCWRWGKTKVNNEFEKLVFKNGKVYTKYYRPEGIVPKSLLIDTIYGRTETGNDDIKKVFDNERPFSYPKPISLIKHFIMIGSNENDIVLDLFSGSGSTAQSILQYNIEDGANRKFIMVQIPEETDEKSEAHKAGYKTIPEIGKERIRRAGKKIVEENTEKLKERETPLDVGFRVYKTSESILKEVLKHPNEVTQTDLFDSQDNIKETATSEDILTAVLLDFGLTLDNIIATKDIAGSTIYFVDDNALVACFDTNIDMLVVEEIAKTQPLRAVFRDACFKDDKDLINTVESRFKQLAPNTKVHVI